VKFADADLIGIPHRLVISDRGLENNQVEYKARRAADAEMLEADAVVATLTQRMRA
jgi:prolyl-tRNA synthetase